MTYLLTYVEDLSRILVGKKALNFVTFNGLILKIDLNSLIQKKRTAKYVVLLATPLQVDDRATWTWENHEGELDNVRKGRRLPIIAAVTNVFGRDIFG